MALDNPITPMLALGITSYANQWYNTGKPTDVKPLLFAGVAAIFLEGFAALGFEKAATLLGWTAFVGMLISPVQKPSPIENLLKIGNTTGGKKHG
jgi:hypothetical protein